MNEKSDNCFVSLPCIIHKIEFLSTLMTSGSDAYLEKSAIEGGGLLLSEVAEELKELNQSLYPDVKKDEGHETKCEQE